MRDHTKLRAFELADEVRVWPVNAQKLIAFSLQPKQPEQFPFIINNKVINLESVLFGGNT
ncbi:MAG: hypothetical protein JRC68_00575 [Deltaproteobacteria bacterium]|nr:hypothetical protein [Deltaproteobacteria bacterium]